MFFKIHLQKSESLRSVHTTQTSTVKVNTLPQAGLLEVTAFLPTHVSTYKHRGRLHYWHQLQLLQSYNHKHLFI